MRLCSIEIKTIFFFFYSIISQISFDKLNDNEFFCLILERNFPNVFHNFHDRYHRQIGSFEIVEIGSNLNAIRLINFSSPH